MPLPVASAFRGALLGSALLVAGACTNDPYPAADADAKVLYSFYREAHKTLDPAVSYTTVAAEVLGPSYDTLLEYHYLDRPYRLIPGLATELPQARTLEDGRVSYRFELRPDLRFQRDPCFAAVTGSDAPREVTASDFAFQLARIADPAVGSPIIDTLSAIEGFARFGERLDERRERDPDFAERPVHEQYAEIGPIAGVRTPDATSLEIVLTAPYPQLLYWFAMPFTTAVAWEAVAYYDGEEGRPAFSDHPVGTGPYRMVHYDKQSRIVLETNPEWYGVRHPEWRAPGAIYPTEGEAGDRERGLLDPDVVGTPLPRIERVEFRREREQIPMFAKFLQGYYDLALVVRESFDQVISGGDLSPDMAARGIRLDRSVRPGVHYVGFNMLDPVVGAADGERSRKLRQAMSLTLDIDEYRRLFTNGRGIAAQSPVPPGLFGYEADYVNPYRRHDPERAAELLVEAGYPGGVDPATGKPLALTFHTYDTTAKGLERVRFYVQGWRRIGLDVAIEPSTYNQFQQRVREGSFQVFQWGWLADYPDPENFLALLTTGLARSISGGPNSANFSNPTYDALFQGMRTRPNDAVRLDHIRRMREILEEERPWIELFHPEDYELHHAWLQRVKAPGMSIDTLKYRDIDPALRARMRADWNRPVMWPLYGGGLLGLLVLLPAVRSFLRERQ